VKDGLELAINVSVCVCLHLCIHLSLCVQWMLTSRSFILFRNLWIHDPQFVLYGCSTFRLAVHGLLPLFVLCKVVGMTSVAVDSFDDIEQWIEQGNKKRSIAATKMNETSRCHHLVWLVAGNSFICYSWVASWTWWSEINLREKWLNWIV